MTTGWKEERRSPEQTKKPRSDLAVWLAGCLLSPNVTQPATGTAEQTVA